MSVDFDYDSSNFIFETQPGSRSLFDEYLESTWILKVANGYFRYKLKDLRTKSLEGEFQFVAQLNEERAKLRRKPQDVTNIHMPFDPNTFHFGKVPAGEKIFNIRSLDWGLEKTENNQKGNVHALIINVSPLEQCHSLFVPSIDLCHPQVLIFDALRAAVEVMLCSANSNLRMGFNSLGAYASVNHLHFHIYQLNSHLYLETAPVELLEGPCYCLTSYPAEGFAFEVKSQEEICNVARAIMLLIDYLIANEIPHNIFMTRGIPFSSTSTKKELYQSLRIYVWARRSFYGMKTEYTGFNMAVCELSGQLPIKDQATYDTINEDEVVQQMKEVCQEVMCTIKDEVCNIYKNI